MNNLLSIEQAEGLLHFLEASLEIEKDDGDKLKIVEALQGLQRDIRHQINSGARHIELVARKYN